MVAVDEPFGEKLTFLWHNHFATAATKVRRAGWLAGQNETLRRAGRGDFRSLAVAMLTDPAMLFWLDGQKNSAAAPNENLSREFMELFALGHGDGYTEQDVREGARALTGWRFRPNGSVYQSARAHDDGVKTVLGVTGNLDTTGFCDAVLSRAASARFVASRMWSQLVSANPPSAPTLDRLVAAYGAQRDLRALLTAMLTSADFVAAHGTIVIGPVDPGMDRVYIGRTFAVVVLAGLGSMTGTLAAGLILGITESVVLMQFGASWAPAVAFGLLLVVLGIRPQGLFGR